MTQKKTLIALLTGVLMLAAGAGVALWLYKPEPKSKTFFGELPDIGGAYSVLDETGAISTDQSFPGKYRIYFFGFTHCPDVCPTALGTIAAALDGMGGKADAFVPLFVTVDPERDTPEIVKDYTDAFDPRIIGLTGSVEQITGLAKSFKIYFRKVPQGDSYTMDHSGFIYVMNPEGKFVAFFKHEDTPERITTGLRQVLSKAGA
ncbi:SCO family protein [Lacibacterium aquatile]|uniref:SCO family protein n=1 Tax=Lacibacterium aquatile TaxID=1168082 RepID=A0ABW5DR32_9PROT